VGPPPNPTMPCQGESGRSGAHGGRPLRPGLRPTSRGVGSISGTARTVGEICELALVRNSFGSSSWLRSLKKCGVSMRWRSV